MTFHYNFNPFKCSDPKYTLKKYVHPLVVLPVFLLTVKIILQSRTLFCLFEHKRGKHISSLYPHKGQSFVSYWGPKVKAAVFLAGSKEPLCSRGAQQSYSVSSQAAAQARAAAAVSAVGQRVFRQEKFSLPRFWWYNVHLFLLNSERDLFLLFSCATTKVAYVSESKSSQFMWIRRPLGLNGP